MKAVATILGLGLASLTLAGCAGAAPDAPAGDSASPESDAPASGGICDILSPDDVATALGGAFADGTPRRGQVTANGVEWTTTGCGWEGEAMEVAASSARGDDFPGGFECLEPSTLLSGEVTPLDDLGSLAWWTWDDFQGGSGVAIVCGDDIRIEVEVTGPRDGEPIDEASARDGATTLASQLLASLG